MKTKLCLPIQETTLHAVLAKIRRAKNYDLVEIWLTCIHRLTVSDVQKIIETRTKGLIVVTRPPRGKRTRLSQALINDVIEACHINGVLIDVDLRTQKQLLKKSQLAIISFHDFHGTPSLSVLRNIIAEMQQFHPIICKIATMCHTPEDALRLLTFLLELRKKHIPCIIIGMGIAGKITRIAGCLWGNEIMYASQEESRSSAPGQLTQKNLQTILNLIEKE